MNEGSQSLPQTNGEEESKNLQGTIQIASEGNMSSLEASDQEMKDEHAGTQVDAPQTSLQVDAVSAEFGDDFQP